MKKERKRKKKGKKNRPHLSASHFRGMPIRCQEVVVVKLIGAAKRRWAGIADNVSFPGELKLGGEKSNTRRGLSPWSLPEVQPFIFTCMSAIRMWSVTQLMTFNMSMA